MTAINPQSVNLDTIALTTATAALVTKLQEHLALAVAHHPAVHACLQLWPLVLVAAGLVLLVTSHGTPRSVTRSTSQGDKK